jgi:hypothetical protein
MADNGRIAPRTLERGIRRIRAQNVMLDADLAPLYGVEVRTLNQAVSRNRLRFPPDFMFALDAREAKCLRSQSVISNRRGGRRYRPFAFTEQGVAMLSSVLRSPRAIRVNIEIIRAFVRLRRMLDSNTELARRLAALEQKYDGQFTMVFDAIRELIAPPARAGRRIGFRRPEPTRTPHVERHNNGRAR